MNLEFTPKPIILIDTSYYVFYRYFATNRWFSFQNKEFNVEDIIENPEFISSFLKHFESDLKKITKKWKTVTQNIVFCLDCQRCNIWRNDIFDQYKGNRVQNLNFNNKIFTFFIDHLSTTDLKVVHFERLEADDVIFLIQDKLKQVSANDIIIISNDNDYLQIVSDRTTIVNMQFKDIISRGNKDGKVNLYHKAIFGDKSDNIHKIASYITKEKSFELSKMKYEDILLWLEKHNLIEKFNNNMLLICFENIPKQLSDNFYENLQISIQ